MATLSNNVTLLFLASGSKVKGGWQELSTVMRDVIATTLTTYKTAPTQRLSLGSAVNSWSYFAQPGVLQAYLNVSTFPLPDNVVSWNMLSRTARWTVYIVLHLSCFCPS